jgi:hypothetical protein
MSSALAAPAAKIEPVITKGKDSDAKSNPALIASRRGVTV